MSSIWNWLVTPEPIARAILIIFLLVTLFSIGFADRPR